MRRGILIGLTVAAAGLAAVYLAVTRLEAVQDAIFEQLGREALAASRDNLFADDALRVLVCGSSSPLPDAARAKSCTIVIAGGKFYIVDTGPESWSRLARWRLPGERIGAVFLTHFHSDHIAELGEFNMFTWVAGRPAPLPVYGPLGVEQVVAGFTEAYALDQTYRTAHHTSALMPPETWPMRPMTIALEDGGGAAVALDDGALKVTMIGVSHDPVDPAVGYRFDYKGRSVVISGDTVAHPPLASAAKGADVLVHEAMAMHMIEKIGEWAADAGNARLAQVMTDIADYHTSPVDAARIANEAGARLLVLSHLAPATPNIVAEAIFTRGMDDARDGDWVLAHDGMLIELPLGSAETRVSDIQ